MAHIMLVIGSGGNDAISALNIVQVGWLRIPVLLLLGDYWPVLPQIVVSPG